jgi:hypothetical protein
MAFQDVPTLHWEGLLAKLALDCMMDTLAFALVVGGLASLCSGLVFLIPVRGGSTGQAMPASQDMSVEDARARVERELGEIRRVRGEIDM